MEVIVLGTSSGVPTKDRNHSSHLVSTKNYDILMDCGEGTQRQLKIKGLNPTRIKKILLTHWHGDHSLGLLGLLQSLAFLNQETVRIEIYGPKQTKKRLKILMEGFVFQGQLNLVIKECKSGKIFEDEYLEIHCLPMNHSTDCIAFSIKEKDKRKIKMSEITKLKIPEGPMLNKFVQGKSLTFKGKKINAKDVTYTEKGKKLVYVTDTVMCDNAIKLAKDADLLICEATYDKSLEEKAKKHSHMTTHDAATIASEAKVKKLLLTHFSPRYTDLKPLEDEAKEIFSETKCTFDFMRVRI